MKPPTGQTACLLDYDEGAHHLFVAIQCQVGTRSGSLLALFDTAAQWCVLPPELAASVAGELDLLEHVSHFSTRYGVFSGWLARVPITFPADEGNPLVIDATCLIPEDWPGPLVIGWKGCLERMRFGVDPFEEIFYFGGE